MFKAKNSKYKETCSIVKKTILHLRTIKYTNIKKGGEKCYSEMENPKMEKKSSTKAPVKALTHDNTPKNHTHLYLIFPPMNLYMAHLFLILPI